MEHEPVDEMDVRVGLAASIKPFGKAQREFCTDRVHSVHPCITMDADDDVEMTNGGFGKNPTRMNVRGLAIESASSDQANSAVETSVTRQNRCFVCTMVILLVAVFVYSGLSYNKSVEEIETVEGAYVSDVEEFQNGVNPQLVAEGITKIKPHVYQHASSKGQHHTEVKEPPPPSPSPTIGFQDWLEACVTLEDGGMYEIVEQLQHGRKSFTEGLTFANGKLYESVGLNRHSAILALDPATGGTLQRVEMDSRYFGEGLTYVNGELIQLTYKMKEGFIYDAANLTSPPRTFTYETTTGEGWGMTYDHDRDEIIVSDGSHYLLFWDPKTFTEKRRVPITRMSGRKASQINELEYWRGRVIANVWFEDSLLVIHPETGVIEKEYDLSDLWRKRERRNHGADVLNGISVSAEDDVLYITGKNWDRMFKIRYVRYTFMNYFADISPQSISLALTPKRKPLFDI